MAILSPLPICTVEDSITAYSYLEQTPQYYQVLANQLNQENTTSVDGRYSEPRGEIHGTASGGGNLQDTYLLGTAARSGIGFQVIAGQGWTSNEYHSEYHVNGIGLVSGGVQTSPSEVVSSGAYETIPSCEIIVRRGQPPVAAMGTPNTTHTSENNYCYITLGHQSQNSVSLRIELVYGKPVRVSCSYDGSTYKPVNSPRDLGNLERYLIGNDREMRIKVSPDAAYQVLNLEFGDGDHVTFAPSKSLITQQAEGETRTLPLYGKHRFQVLNATFRGFILPSRFKPIVVERLTPHDFGTPQVGMSDAYILHNSLTQSSPDQKLETMVSTDGQSVKYTATVSRPDAGDGMGSAEPPVLSDIGFIIPPIWATSDPASTATWGPTAGNPSEVLRTQSIQILEVFDDISQTAYQSGVVTVNNYDGAYNGSYGHVACKVDASAVRGGAFDRLFTGWGGSGEGIVFERNDPKHTMTMRLQDRSLSMQPGLNDEQTFDGWYLFGIVRWLAQTGGIHPRYLQSIPELKYGPAQPGDYVDTDQSGLYYALPRGYGINPRYRYPIGMSIWSILQDLVTKLATIDPTTGLPLRWYMGFDTYGNFHFEPISFVDKQPVAMYSSRNLDGTGMYMITNGLRVTNSIENLRTSLDLMGIDALTYELLYYHLPMPEYVKHAVGFRFPYQERHASYASEEYIKYIAQAAAIQCSLPVQRLNFTVPYTGFVHAGDVIGVSEQKTLGGGGYYKIDEIAHNISIAQNGQVTSMSTIACKALINTL